MSDDLDQLTPQDIAAAAPLAVTAYQGYKAYNRMAPFIQGGVDAFQGGTVGSLGSQIATKAITGTAGPTVRAAVGGIGRAAVTRAAVGFGLRAGAGAAATAASGAAAGASAGTAVMPIAGTLIGAAAGALAPLIIPHTPLAGPISRIPLIGGFLSPKQTKKKVIPGGTVAVRTGSDPGVLSTGASSQMVPWEQMNNPRDFARSARAEYNAGRGFRRT